MELRTITEKVLAREHFQVHTKYLSPKGLVFCNGDFRRHCESFYKSKEEHDYKSSVRI
jgi:hypothetical protein